MPTTPAQPSASAFNIAPTDPNAVYLQAPTGGDDTPAIQEAIAEVRRRDGYGLIFVPEGLYQIHSTVYLPLGIRLVGFGAARPLFRGHGIELLIHVCNLPPTGDRPAVDGDIDQLFARECRFENISAAVVQTADRDDVDNMVNIVNSVCTNSPVFLEFRNDTPEPIANSSPIYHVRTCSHGLHITNATRRLGPFGTPTDLTPPALQKTTFDTRALEAIPPAPGKDYPNLPPVEEWVSVRDAGAVGDGATDDTHAFKRAIAEHRVIYVPTGRYRITDTLTLRADTVIIGLQPIRTLFVLPPDTPGFGDPGNPKPVIESAHDGTNMVTGVGFYSEENPGAVMLKWLSGKDSCADDVWFGKEYLTNPEYLDRWTRNRDGDWRPDRPVTSTTRCGLWITGGGTFKNIWISDWSAAVGLLITDTSTPGRIYGISVEHHLENEVRIQNAVGWSLDALQTEADDYAEHTLAVDMADCRDITFGNLFAYRRVALETSHPHAVRIQGCAGLTFRGLHVFSWGPHPFSNSLYDADTQVYVRHREIAHMTVRQEAL